MATNTNQIDELLTSLEEVLANAPDGRGGVMANDPALRRKVSSIRIGCEALRALEARAKDKQDRDKRTVSPRQRSGLVMKLNENKELSGTEQAAWRNRRAREASTVATGGRARAERPDDPAARVGDECGLALAVAIKRAELQLAIGGVAADALAYQALPLPEARAGDNEPPVGGAYARLARQVMLAGFHEQAEAPAELRDRLARCVF